MLFVPGTGTLKSVSYEAAFVEACQLLELAEESSSTPESVNFTNVDHDNTGKDFNITCQLPFDVTITSLGVPTFTPTTYVVPAFVNTGSDIDATTLTGAVLQLAQTIQNVEKSTPSVPNNFNIVYNTDDGTGGGVATITASIPCVKSVTSTGAILTTVTTYLP